MFELPHGLARTKNLRESLRLDTQNVALDHNGEELEGIGRAKLFALNDLDAVNLFGATFAPELSSLKNAAPTVESSPIKTTEEFGPFPSQLLFHEDYAEVNRTIVGMLALKWLVAGDYDAFTGQQFPAAKLRRESFDQLRELFMSGLKTEDDVYALLVATVVNDLGKDPDMPEKAIQFLQDYPPNPNHDMVVYIAAKHGMLPLINESEGTASHQKLMQGLLFGSEVNIAQLAQAESAPSTLRHVKEIMAGQEHAFTLKFMELILDVAGADGHHDARCAKPMIEPVFQGYMVARQALMDIVQDKCSAREGYDQVLCHRARLLAKNGFTALSVHDPYERALLRLVTMGRTTTKDQASWFDQAFRSLSYRVRQALSQGLNVDGIDDGVAIIPYYMPALFSETLKTTSKSSADGKVTALASLMRFLARIFAGTKPVPGAKSEVIECSVAFAQHVIKSQDFKNNPNILDDLVIPEASRYVSAVKVGSNDSINGKKA
ncbi:hypothetical protein MMC26_005135 [Xylographa opegraphella]|nr:hypothetical protein [Xylographa opegraphella]